VLGFTPTLDQVRVATINKSQGQTLSHVGLHFTDDVFSHGQLYVAFSPAKALENIKVQLPYTVHG